MRISQSAMDLTGFRKFLEAQDAIFGQPRAASGEVIRFTIGKARGSVHQRKNGSFTLVTMAVTLYREFQEAQKKHGK